MIDAIFATVFVGTQNSSSMSNFDWKVILQNPFVQYILSPVIVFGILIFIVVKIFHLAEFKANISNTLEKVKD